MIERFLKLVDASEVNRQEWLKSVLGALPKGGRILDAGAGELKNAQYCQHLRYVSQDFCQYQGLAGGSPNDGLQPNRWDVSCIDVVSDITAIPAEDNSFDAILCSEVLEHIPDPTKALDEFSRLLKPGGLLILTAPFASNVHMAPFHYCTGFSKYWYEYHLPKRNLVIQSLVPNGDWYASLRQEITRLGSQERSRGNWAWPIAYVFGLVGVVYFKIRRPLLAHDLASFGWFCLARKS